MFNIYIFRFNAVDFFCICCIIKFLTFKYGVVSPLVYKKLVFINSFFF